MCAAAATTKSVSVYRQWAEFLLIFNVCSSLVLELFLLCEELISMCNIYNVFGIIRYWDNDIFKDHPLFALEAEL